MNRYNFDDVLDLIEALSSNDCEGEYIDYDTYEMLSNAIIEAMRLQDLCNEQGLRPATKKVEIDPFIKDILDRHTE